LGNLRISNAKALGSGLVTIGNGAPATLQLTNGITLTNALVVQSKPTASGLTPNVENLSESNTVSGPMQFTQNGTSGWIFTVTGGHLLVSGTNTAVNSSQTSQTTTRTLLLNGPADGEWSGGIVDSVNSVTNLSLHKDGLGTWILSGADTYTGPTVISNGTLVVNGSLSASSTVTVAGGTLGGNGLIRGPVVVNDVGTIAPGSSIGTLTISNSLTLNGTASIEFSHTGADKVAGVGSLTLGGTLHVDVIGSLTGGEIFRLFEATSYSGDFSFYDLPTLASPLAWDASSVPLDGTLKVTGGAPPQPTISGVSLLGTNLVFFVPTVLTGTYVVQSTTNLAPVSVWFNESTNAGTGGNLNLSVPIKPNTPKKFVRILAF
jgi:autotransporter-associated beta strand protein